MSDLWWLISQIQFERLEKAFSLWFSEEEALQFARVWPTLFNVLRDKYPWFDEVVHEWRKRMDHKALEAVYNNLNDPKVAKWYLERKRSQEYWFKQYVWVQMQQQEQPIQIIFDKKPQIWPENQSIFPTSQDDGNIERMSASEDLM